jgi:outer membrane receptor protein involved in Fe transport
MNWNRCLGLALVVGLPAAAPLHAQATSPSPAPSASPTLSEYIEVTATRIPEPPEQVPAPIEVFTGQELRDRNATDLRGALSLAAGVDIAQGGDAGPAGSVPEFYGLKEFDAFLLVVDGVPWGGAFNPALTTLDLTDVERVEVLRGPAPVMYGATSFVGVIHVVHKDAGATRRAASVTFGSFGSGRASGTVRLPKWAGFDSGLTADVTRQGFSDDRTAVRRGHLRWRNARTLGSGRLRLDVDGTLLDQDPASPHPREGASLSAAVPLDANHNPDGAFLKDRRILVTTGYERPVGGATWATTFSYGHSGQNEFRGFLTDVSNDAPNARGLRKKLELNDVYFDSHLAWTAANHVKVVAGIDHLQGEGDATGAVFGYFAPLGGSVAPVVAEPTVLDLDAEDRRAFSGLYGFTEWNPYAAVRLEAGVRLNRTKETRGEGEPAPGGTEPAQEHVRLSGSVGASWTAWERGSDRLRLFANYTNTFKPAAVDFGLAEEESEGILEPETASSIEGGVRGQAWEGRLSLEGSAFLMDFHNLVIAQAVNGLPALANAGAERFKGFEAAASVRLQGDWNGRATYSFHDARFRDFLTEFDGVPTQLAGKRLEMSARHMFSAGLVHAPGLGLLALAEVQHVGSRFLNKRNTALAPGYTTLAAALGWRFKRYEVRVDGTNLTDRRDPVAESELGDAQYYRLHARRIEATASVRF